VKVLFAEPRQISAWRTGSEGERRLAERLTGRLGPHAVPLLDRKVPGTRGNIDLLFVAASGVWVIDAKKYRGPVERRDNGGLLTSDYRLYVNRRDCTSLVDGLGWQVRAVRAALNGLDTPVHAAICFVDAEWRLFAKAFQIKGVWVSSGKALPEMIAAPGPLADSAVVEIAHRLASALPASDGST
jgi:hypothetical protein